MNDGMLLDTDISETAITLLGTYRLSHGLLIADSLIAATAMVHSQPLFSGNAKHFSMIAGLVLLNDL